MQTGALRKTSRARLAEALVTASDNTPYASTRDELHRLEFQPRDPELRRHLGTVAAHLLDEPLRVLTADEHLERVAEREVGREGIVDDHAVTMTRRVCGRLAPRFEPLYGSYGVRGHSPRSPRRGLCLDALSLG